MEQLTVADCIKSKFLDCIWMFFCVFFTNLTNHICNLKTAAADFLTSSALETEILNLAGTLFVNKEVGKHDTDTTGIYLGAIYMAAD